MENRYIITTTINIQNSSTLRNYQDIFAINLLRANIFCYTQIPRYKYIHVMESEITMLVCDGHIFPSSALWIIFGSSFQSLKRPADMVLLKLCNDFCTSNNVNPKIPQSDQRL
jgi:hypothetical protein